MAGKDGFSILKKMTVLEKIVIALSAVGVALVIFLWSFSSLKISDVQFDDPKDGTMIMDLPLSAAATVGQITSFSVTVHKNWFSRHRVCIIPDDHALSLTVNGKELSLKKFARGEWNDWRRGFSYPLGRFLQTGENTVVITILNYSGITGLDVYMDFADPMGMAVWIFGLLCLMGILGIPLRRIGVRWDILFMIFIGVSVWCTYVLSTPWHARAYDILGHVDYIQYVFNHWKIPKPDAGWMFYHPSLYYFSAAGFWRILNFYGLERPLVLKALQFQSFIYVLGFAAFSFLTIYSAMTCRAQRQKCSMGKNANLLPLGLLMFWPSMIIHSARIGNDSLFYLLSGLSFYFVIKWWISDRIPYFRWAAFFAALGMLTKSNAVILFFVMGLLFVIRWFRTGSRGWRLFLKKTSLVAVLFIAVVLLNYTRPVYDMLSGKQVHLLVRNLDRLPKETLQVNNTIKTYVFFDIKNFFDQPYTSTHDDNKGRQFFWNYLLKTSLFGEYGFSDGLFSVALARGLSCGLIFIIVFPCLRFFRPKIPWTKQCCDVPMAVLYLLFVASLMILRISAPFSPTGDFRYILPVLVSVIYFYCAAIDDYQSAGWGWAVWAGRIVGWGFCIVSGLFMIGVVF